EQQGNKPCCSRPRGGCGEVTVLTHAKRGRNRPDPL
ncbi:hypothetical protein, partial [Pseudomonas phage vB_Pae_CF53c]